MEKKKSIDQSRSRGEEPSAEDLKGIERELAWESRIIGRMTDNGVELFDEESDSLDDQV